MTTLAVRLDNDGDVLLTGPAVRALAAREAVDVLAAPSGAGAARLLPGVRDVLVMDAPWSGYRPPPVDAAALRELVDQLAARRYDRAVVFTSFHQSPLPMALLLKLAGVPYVAATSVDYPGSLLDVRHHRPEGLHEVEAALDLVRATGADLPRGDDGRLAVRRPLPDVTQLLGTTPPADSRLTRDSRVTADSRLTSDSGLTSDSRVVADSGLTSDSGLTRDSWIMPGAGSSSRRERGTEGAGSSSRRARGTEGAGSSSRRERDPEGAGSARRDGAYVVLHPGASVPARATTPEHARAIAAALVDAGWDVVVTGGPAEAPLDAGPGVRDLTGRTDLAELAAVLDGAACVVVGNTGPAHLAAAVGTPVVSLFSPVVPAERWAPYGVPTIVLGDQLAACRGTRARECPVPGHPCLTGIDPEQVVHAVESLVPQEVMA